MGVLVGGTATNEEAFLAREIARHVFGSEAEGALGPVLRATKEALEARLGTWRMAAGLDALGQATTIVVVHDDLEESHNVASLRIKDAVVDRGARLVVIGALRSELCDFATAWIRPVPNEEGAAAARLADALAAGAADAELEPALAVLRQADPERTMVVVAPNPVSATKAAAMAGGAANLAVALAGERASERLVVLPPETNANGLLDLGVGASSTALDGLAGLLVFRDDPTLWLPAAAPLLGTLETVVVIDGVLHETAQRAAVVIAEGRAYASEGTYTTGDFRVQRLSRALRPEGQAVDGYTALLALGEALGLSLPPTPGDALARIAEERPEYQVAADLIVGEGVKLPIPPSGRGVRAPVEPLGGPAEGIRLIASRDLYTALDAAALRHPEAEPLHRYDRVRISRQDARRLGLREGAAVEISDGRTTFVAPAAIDERVPEGAVYLSSLMAGGIAAAFFAASPSPLLRVGAPVTA